MVIKGYYKGWNWRFKYITKQADGGLDFFMYVNKEGYDTDISGVNRDGYGPEILAQELIDECGWMIESDRQTKLKILKMKTLS